MQKSVVLLDVQCRKEDCDDIDNMALFLSLFVRLSVAKFIFASVTWNENHICVAPCYTVSYIFVLSSFALVFLGTSFNGSFFFKKKDRMVFFNIFSLQLICDTFFNPGWNQSPHYVSAHKNPSSTDPQNPLLASSCPRAMGSVAWGGSCNGRTSFNFPWQSRDRSSMQFHPPARKLKYRHTCTYHCTYIYAFLVLCIEFHAARMRTNCCLRCLHHVRAWWSCHFLPYCDRT
jgi:hypothetical protein